MVLRFLILFVKFIGNIDGVGWIVKGYLMWYWWILRCWWWMVLLLYRRYEDLKLWGCWEGIWWLFLWGMLDKDKLIMFWFLGLMMVSWKYWFYLCLEGDVDYGLFWYLSVVVIKLYILVDLLKKIKFMKVRRLELEIVKV